MSLSKGGRPSVPSRGKTRFAVYRDLSIIYEGSSEDVSVRVPDISPRGMFINTARYFPQGAVLKLKFSLWRSNFEITARGEVRYCLPGVGIGLEFVEISPEARRAIEEELAAAAAAPSPSSS